MCHELRTIVSERQEFSKTAGEEARRKVNARIGRAVSTTVNTGDGTFRVIASVLYRRDSCAFDSC